MRLLVLINWVPQLICNMNGTIEITYDGGSILPKYYNSTMAFGTTQNSKPWGILFTPFKSQKFHRCSYSKGQDN